MELVRDISGLADATLRLLLDLVHPVLEIRLCCSLNQERAPGCRRLDLERVSLTRLSTDLASLQGNEVNRLRILRVSEA